VGNAVAGGVDGARLDAALRSLYAYCQAMDVPILAHANHSNGFAEGYDDLAGPQGWKAVLSDFPRLRLCFGHFGHLWQVGAMPSEPDPAAWVLGFVDLVDTYDHVYGDVGNSRFPIDERYRRDYLELLRVLLGADLPSNVQRKRRRRLMFGTDYWMNTLSPGHRDYLSVFETHFRRAFDDETASSFFGGNALRWLGILDEDGGPDHHNANRARLLEFYGDRPLPDWLAA
jgi:predicted TIM-barrel fold metal-dependent hydrolase